MIAELRAPEARARSPKAKKIWETLECEKFWSGYVVTSVRPTVRTQSHNANAPVFICREVTWRDSLARCVYNRNAKEQKNTIYTYSVCARRPCWRTKTIEYICIKIEYISKRKIMVLFWSSNMAVVLHILFVGYVDKRGKKN